MKLRRYFSAFAAASLAVSAVSAVSYAAPVLTVKADSASSPSNNIIKTADDGKIDLSKVKTVKVTVTSTIDGNLGIGCNNAADGKWTQVDGNFAAGTQTYELKVDGISIDAKENFVVMVGVWWMNGAGTLTVDSIEMLDANGKVPEIVVVDEPTVEVTEPTEEVAEPTVEETVEVVEPTVEETVEETVEVNEPVEADVNEFFDGGTVYLVRDDGFDGYIDVTGEDITEIYGVKFNVTFDDAEVADEAVWVGGGVGANSNSTSWEQHEWGKASGMKEITPDFENGTITWFKGEPIFTDAEEYAQLWIQSWGGSLTVDSVELLYSDYVPEEVTTPDVDNTDTDTDNGSADDNKGGNPDTGVAGVAVAAGVVALAGAAVVATRKRK